ncbi:MAG: bifunctional class I SAM-dependent methyltransferase/glycosyltransferase family 2 protein [Desulfobacterales bacterium]|jgi:ubiquinone/menaquinone biosynthesis C-methylase UbiE
MNDTNTFRSSQAQFTVRRIRHWNAVSSSKCDPQRPGRYYQELLVRYYRHHIPEGLRILELGCGGGDLLAALQPRFGVGVDFSGEMLKIGHAHHPELQLIQADVHALPLKGTFDVIILSDLVNDLYDVQAVLSSLHSYCHKGTRLVCNLFSNLWRLPLKGVQLAGWGADVLVQNWLTLDDFRNLMSLADFEIVSRRAEILLPVKVPFLSAALNRYLSQIAPLSWFCLTNFFVARSRRPESRPKPQEDLPSVSVIVPARNEAGNIASIIERLPDMGSHTEIVFVEGFSRDRTYETIQEQIQHFPSRDIKLFKQVGEGKGSAVRLGFDEAKGDILMILDADMTVPPEDLPRFYDLLAADKCEFVNGVRLVYPMEDQAMRFLNMLGNRFFSMAFTWLLGQPIRDTLCGTKVLFKEDYRSIARNRGYFGDFDPFGDFDLLFGAAKLNFKIREIPIRYRSRTYGDTNIDRWRHGWLLIRMVVFAARRIKFI